jgi:L-ascorbate metabolism protein UlaG (beta-lactamase superfamily)
MDLTWLGTAGFIVKSKEGEIIFDPFLSRGKGESSPFTTKSFENSQALFVGHGHFDHTFDIPEISKGTDFKIFAPGLTKHILKFRGVPSHRLTHTNTSDFLFKPFKVRAFHSSHVIFDMPLVVSTAKRCGIKGCLQACGLGLAYPKGLVQTYLFEAEGKKILYMSSAGANEKELLVYRDLEIDYFLAPLQGHSSIQEIAARQTSIIQPKVVIPHHHDDFFPPLSQNISVDIFREKLKQLNYKGDVLEIPLFQSSLI